MGQKSLSEVNATIHTDKSTPWKRFLSFAGPAYLISVGYMDPGNWATDIAGGSAFGYKLIWVLLASNLIALLLQSLSARLGVVGGLDLAQASKNAYPNWVNIPLYILAEIAIAACDLAEIVGMAIGLNLVFGLPLIWGISITAFDTILLLFLLKKGMRIMEMVIISLIFIIGLSFLIEMIIVKPVIGDVLLGFIPTNLDGSALYIAIGIIGATVMPHNLYLHSSLVQTRKIDPSFKGIKNALKYNFIDSAIALNLAFFVNAAILILAAAAFYVNGYFGVAEIQDASHLLDNLFGKTAPMFFGIALIASGQSSTITGTLAGQIVMEGHLNLRIQPWLRRLITRLLAIIPALFTILYFGEQGLGSLLILSQVVLSLQLGFAIIPLIHFNSDKILMREFVIKPWVKILAWTSAVLIVYLNVRLVVEEIGTWMEAPGDHLLIYTLVIPIVLASLALLIYIFVYPIISPKMKEKKQLPHGYAKKIALTELTDYKRIGIAIDFSGNDQVLIQNALKQGGKSANYTFIHIVETAAARYLGKNALDNETKLDEQNIRIYQDRLRELGYTADFQIGFGAPANEIVKIVLAHDLDFLVLGSHGHKELKDLVFGTTVDKVRHRIQIPLLIVYK
ncbi:MAG: iron/manganese transporter [Flavobacteriales bacterium CG_4_9_14_3_um_filter_40_17]|nr:MAG: iron/manganese transporter [Flavobacteriales bacterium CG_4_9_14_3_um_filter_40_17]